MRGEVVRLRGHARQRLELLQLQVGRLAEVGQQLGHHLVQVRRARVRDRRADAGSGAGASTDDRRRVNQVDTLSSVSGTGSSRLVDSPSAQDRRPYACERDRGRGPPIESTGNFTSDFHRTQHRPGHGRRTRGQGHPRALPHPDADDPPRPHRPGHHRPGQDRHRQDLRLRPPAHPAPRPRPGARRARRSSSSRPASWPSRSPKTSSSPPRTARPRSSSIYGGKAYEGQIEQLKAGAQIVVGTPGRLLDLAGQRLLTSPTCSEMVLDEADKMLDLGFLADIEKLFAQTPATRHTMLFSATMPGPIVALARRFMTKPDPHPRDRPRRGPDRRRTSSTSSTARTRMDKDEVIARILQAEGRGKTVIFTRTKRAAAKLVEELNDRGFNAAAVHGDLNQEQRERAMAAFKAGKNDILIATDVAARGIDVDDVTHVINHTIPEDDEDVPAPRRPHRPRRQDRHRRHVRRLGRPAQVGAHQPRARVRPAGADRDLLVVAAPLHRPRHPPGRQGPAQADPRREGLRTSHGAAATTPRAAAGPMPRVPREAMARAVAAPAEVRERGCIRRRGELRAAPSRQRRPRAADGDDHVATGTHDGGGAQHRDGNSAPRRRRRRSRGGSRDDARQLSARPLTHRAPGFFERHTVAEPKNSGALRVDTDRGQYQLGSWLISNVHAAHGDP